MKLTVLGATGNLGREIVAQALTTAMPSRRFPDAHQWAQTRVLCPKRRQTKPDSALASRHASRHLCSRGERH